jgi:hypothetical protein
LQRDWYHGHGCRLSIGTRVCLPSSNLRLLGRPAMGLSSRSMNTRLHPNVFQVISQAERLNIDASRVSIGGLSAGGHMSAVLSHMARDEGLELRLALMIVPSTDFRWLIAPEPIRSEIAERYSSTVLYKDAPWGGLKRERWFLDYWIPTGKSNMRIVCWSLC